MFWVEQPPVVAAHGLEARHRLLGGVQARRRRAVSKDSKNFSSAENGAIIRFQEGMLREMVEFQRVMLLNQDPPEHTGDPADHLPRVHAPLDRRARGDHDRPGATGSSRRPCERGSGNFVEEVAAELPLQAIADLLGVPQEDRKQAVRLVQPDAGQRGPRLRGLSPTAAATEILVYAMAMAAERRENPQDDLITKLINADKDGRGLNDDEFGYFVIMLTVAGNETTRNAITHGMDAFLDQPRPVAALGRGAPGDHGRRGDPVGDPDQRLPAHRAQRRRWSATWTVKKGQRVGLFYGSANYDEDVFDDALHVRHHPLAQPAPGLRRPRRALLHRRQPGPPGGPADLQRPGRPRARTSAGSARPAGSGTAGSTASRSCRLAIITPASSLVATPRASAHP